MTGKQLYEMWAQDVDFGIYKTPYYWDQLDNTKRDRWNTLADKIHRRLEQ